MKLSPKKAKEVVNMKYLVVGNEEDDKEHHEDAMEQSKESDLDVTATEVDKVCPDTGVERNKRAIDGKEEDDETKNFVIDLIVDHNMNKSQSHRYMKQGQNLYRVRLYRYKPDEYKWEPIMHLPRRKVLSYWKRNIIAIPDDIVKTDAG